MIANIDSLGECLGAHKQLNKEKSLWLFLEKGSEDLKRLEIERKIALMVRSSLSEANEPETFAWNLGNLEVRNRVFGVQVVVILLKGNFPPGSVCAVI